MSVDSKTQKGQNETRYIWLVPAEKKTKQRDEYLVALHNFLIRFTAEQEPAVVGKKGKKIAGENGRARKE